MNQQNICCIFNYASHYRSSIYKLMDKELKCDFYIGANMPFDIKSMDYSILKGYKKSLKNIWFFGKFYWQVGSISLVFKPYRHIIIDGEPYCLSSWIVLLLAKLLRKKTYCWSHGWYGRESKSKKIIKKLFFRMHYHIFLYGDYARELMTREGFQPNKLTCIYNSLDYEKQLTLRKTLSSSDIYLNHFKNDNPNLIFIGRLTSSKKLNNLLHAVAKLKNLSQNYNLTIIGKGECKSKLLSLSVFLGLEENVWFYGDCYDERNISELIFNADVCVSPGNVGLTAIHAMSYGTPVITHSNFAQQMPEFEAIINGKTGTFFEQEDCDSLVESIIRWTTLAIDRDLIRKMCYEIIDTRYNPYYQIEVLKNSLR